MEAVILSYWTKTIKPAEYVVCCLCRLTSCQKWTFLLKMKLGQQWMDLVDSCKMCKFGCVFIRIEINILMFLYLEYYYSYNSVNFVGNK